MNEMNNLSYSLEINYINGSRLNTSISVQFCDNGLETKSVRVGDVCVTEETINGRVLSGKYEDLNGYCGYRYDYQNGENLLNINSQTPVLTAVSLINKEKMGSDFLTAKLVLSSVLRNDYRVAILDKGGLSITRTVSAQNEEMQLCSLQESTDLVKVDGCESFVEQSKETTYTIDGRSVDGETQPTADGEIVGLSTVLSQNPKNYKELISIKNSIQTIPVGESIGEEETL